MTRLETYDNIFNPNKLMEECNEELNANNTINLDIFIQKLMQYRAFTNTTDIALYMLECLSKEDPENFPIIYNEVGVEEEHLTDEYIKKNFN